MDNKLVVNLIENYNWELIFKCQFGNGENYFCLILKVKLLFIFNVNSVDRNCKNEFIVLIIINFCWAKNF